jgi:transcriptional regulator with XRE-family HTH domain
MTQREVAERVGVSQVQVSRWESDGGPKPQPGNRKRLARLFKVPATEIDW